MSVELLPDVTPDDSETGTKKQFVRWKLRSGETFDDFFRTNSGESIILAGSYSEEQGLNPIIDGVRFKNLLDARSCFFDRTIHFQNCIFDAGIDLTDAYVQGSLILENCEFGGDVVLKRIRIGGRLNLKGARAKNHALLLNGATIDAGLRIGGTELPNLDTKEVSRSEFACIDAVDASIKESADFGGIECDGPIRLIRLNVSGSVFFTYRFQNIEVLAGMQSAYESVWNMRTIAAEIDLSGAVIRGDLAAGGIECPGEVKLTGSQIQGNVSFKAWHPCVGETGIEYSDTKYGPFRHLEAIPTRLGSLSAQNCTCSILSLTGCQVAGGVDFRGSRARAIKLSVWKPIDWPLNPVTNETGDLSVGINIKKSEALIALMQPSSQRLADIKEESVSPYSVLKSRAIQSSIEGTLYLSGSHIEGPTVIQGCLIGYGIIGTNANFGGECIITRWRTKLDTNTFTYRTEIGATAIGDRESSIDFRNSTFGGSIVLDGVFCTSAVDLFSVEVRGSIMADPSYSELANHDLAYDSAVLGMGRDGFGRKYSLRLTSAKVNGNVVMRSLFAESALIFESTEIQGELDLGPFRFQNSMAGRTRIGVGAWSPQNAPLPSWGESKDDNLDRKRDPTLVQLRSYTNRGPRGLSPEMVYCVEGSNSDNWNRWVSIFAEGLTVKGPATFDGILCLGCLKATGSTFKSNFSVSAVDLNKDFTNQLEDEGPTPALIYGGTSTAGRPYSLQLGNAHIHGNLYLNGCVLTAGIYMNRAEIGGNVQAIPRGQIGRIPFVSIFIAWHPTQLHRPESRKVSAFRAFGAKIHGVLELRDVILFGGLHIENARIGQSVLLDHISNEDNKIADLTLAYISSRYGIEIVHINGLRNNDDEYLFVLSGARIGSDLRISHCGSGRLLLDDTRIEGTCSFFDNQFDDIKSLQSRCETLYFEYDAASLPRSNWPSIIISSAWRVLAIGLWLLIIPIALYSKAINKLPDGPTLVIIGSIFLLCGYLCFCYSMRASRIRKNSNGDFIPNTIKQFPTEMSFSEFVAAASYNKCVDSGQPQPPVNPQLADNAARRISFKLLVVASIVLGLYLAVPVVAAAAEYGHMSLVLSMIAIGFPLLSLAQILFVDSEYSSRDIDSSGSSGEPTNLGSRSGRPHIGNRKVSNVSYPVALERFLRIHVVPASFYRRLTKSVEANHDEATLRMVTLNETPNLVSGEKITARHFLSWVLHFSVGHGLRLTPLLLGTSLLLILSTSLFGRPESVIRSDYHQAISQLTALHQLTVIGAAASVKSPVDVGVVKALAKVDSSGKSATNAGQNPNYSVIATEEEIASRERSLTLKRIGDKAPIATLPSPISEEIAERWLQDYLHADEKEERFRKLSHSDGLTKLDWRQRTSVGMTLRYFVPFAEFVLGSDWEASPRPIRAPKIVRDSRLYSWMILDDEAFDPTGKPRYDLARTRALTYQDLATILTLMGWLLVPLLIGSITARLRTKVKSGDSE